MNKNAVVIKPYTGLYEYDKKGTVIDEVLHGMKVKILEHGKKYSQIITPYNYAGYIKNSDLAYENKNDKSVIKMYTNSFGSAQKYLISAPFADILSKPNIKSTVIKTLVRGALVCVQSQNDENPWTKIILPDGKTGYVKQSYLKTMPKQITNAALLTTKQQKMLRDNICNTALSYLGTQYRWGGKTPIGIDCSGLVFMAYMLNGIYIYRDAKIKKEFAVKPIQSKNLKKADLLYFPGHVAMYLGGGNFIHSTSHCPGEGVLINSFCKNKYNYRHDLKQSLQNIGSVFV